MGFPILQIAKLLARLTVLAPVAGKTVDTIRTLVETAHNDNRATKQLDALRQALELQSAVNEDVAEQLRVFKSVLDDVQRSLKISVFISIGIGILALAALVIAFLK